MSHDQFHLPIRQLVKGKWQAAILGSVIIWTSQTTLAVAQASDETTWGIGLGVSTTQEPYIDIDRDTDILPLLHFENRYIRFRGTTLEFKLPSLTLGETNSISFRLIGRWDGSGYEASDADILSGMEEREGGIWAGAGVIWQTRPVNVSAYWTHDVSGNSKGQQLTLGINRTWGLSERFTLTPRIGVTWSSSDYIDYYYGVQASEARQGRPEYNASSGVSAELGLQGTYRVTENHAIMFDAQIRSLSSEEKDSPLVDESTEARFSLGYMYEF